MEATAIAQLKQEVESTSIAVIMRWFSNVKNRKGRGNRGATRLDYSSRLVKYYEHHNPDKLKESGFVEKALLKYKGNEEELFKALRAKYGPEPAESSPQSVS